MVKVPSADRDRRTNKEHLAVPRHQAEHPSHCDLDTKLHYRLVEYTIPGQVKNESDPLGRELTNRRLRGRRRGLQAVPGGGVRNKAERRRRDPLQRWEQEKPLVLAPTTAPRPRRRRRETSERDKPGRMRCERHRGHVKKIATDRRGRWTRRRTHLVLMPTATSTRTSNCMRIRAPRTSASATGACDRTERLVSGKEGALGRDHSRRISRRRTTSSRRIATWSARRGIARRRRRSEEAERRGQHVEQRAVDDHVGKPARR